MNLRNLVRAVQEDLPITMRHERWLAANPNPTYSAAALAHAAKVFAHEVGGNRVRKQPFRSSSMGMCPRRRVLSAAGVPERGSIDSRLSSIFGTGNFLHLKWQMAGLTEGWLVEAEVSADAEDLRFGGTLDGVLFDGSGFEFKSINSNGFSSVMTFGPKPLHILQVHSYMLARPDITKFSVVYENKDTQEWREFRVPQDSDVMAQVEAEIGLLNGAYDRKQLPVMRPDCETQEGAMFRQCPFNDVCATFKDWPDIVTRS